MVHHRSNRSMWFGTFDKMGWIPTPQTGADSTADDWSSSGTLLNGGGYANHSWGSNKVFDYSWGKSAARETAQLMKSYRDGAYGRGLLYFHSPLAYSINVLPARWANPAMATQDEGFSHIYNVQPKAMPVTGHEKNGYPVESAQFRIPTGAGGYDERSSLFIPIPPDMTLHLGAVYEYTGTAGVFYRPVSSTGVVGGSVRVEPAEIMDTTIASTEVTGGRGVYLWFGKTGVDAETLTVTAVTARLATTDERTWTNYAANGSAASGSSVGWAGVSGIDSVGGNPMFVSSEVMTPPPVTVPGDASYAAFHASVASPSAGTVTVELRGLTEDVQLSTSGKSVVMETTVNPEESFAPTFTPSGTVGVTDYRVGFGSSPQQARVAAAAAFDYSTEDSAKFKYVPNEPVEFARNGDFNGQDLRVGNVTFGFDGDDSVAYYSATTRTPVPEESRGPWHGGQGHSGCRFDGQPTYVEYTGVNGGQVGFSATFREVGDSVGAFY